MPARGRSAALWTSLLAAALAAAGACAHPPRFVRVTPVLRLLYVPNFMPYIDDPKFSFEVHRRWKGPQSIEGGVQYSQPGLDAQMSIAFVPKVSKAYKPPQEFRRTMAAQGSVEDSHMVAEVAVSSRPASRVRFTTYRYDPQYLIGRKVEVFYTEMLMVPEFDGMYLIRLQAPKSKFDSAHVDYEDFLKSLTFADRKLEE